MHRGGGEGVPKDRRGKEDSSQAASELGRDIEEGVPGGELPKPEKGQGDGRVQMRPGLLAPGGSK
jgi:hypothetical protein